MDGKNHLVCHTYPTNTSWGCPPSPSSFLVNKEHMFDKVVTPSDVGKLNRLVIPKQHAEKHFPLDGAGTEKGLLLNFEDRAGKPWRFRYSYWNSSQSYVITKGWSRFVKEKRLRAGDTVSFARGTSHCTFFIDWKTRPDQHVLLGGHSGSSTWPAAALYGGGGGGRLLFYFPLAAPQNSGVQHAGKGSVAGEVAGRGVVKRVRLFGVNLECRPADSDVDDGDAVPAAGALPQLQLRLGGPS